MTLFEDKAELIGCEDGKCGKCWTCQISGNQEETS
jgi:hypothetical protein